MQPIYNIWVKFYHSEYHILYITAILQQPLF